MFEIYSNEKLSNPFSKIKLYHAKNIHELDSSLSNDFNYFKSLIECGIPHYIDNISAEMNFLKINDTVTALLITSGNNQDSYVCSPFGHYISLAPEGLQFIKNKWLKTIAKHTLKSLGFILKKGKIDHTIYINHSLFSTDLQSNTLSLNDIKSLIAFLTHRFPLHTIIFRSINSETCKHLQNNLKSSGFKFIASRQIYLTGMKTSNLFDKRIIKSDLKLWKECGYDIVDQKDFNEVDEQCALDLYTKLAIDSHSDLNPQININFFKLLRTHPNFQLKALKKEDKIDGIVGYQVKDDILLCSIFGYDKSNKNNVPIYRLLSTFLLLEAAEKAKIFHQSAGASFFKSVRGAQSVQEYQAFYIKHLPFKQKITWRFLKAIINNLAAPFMKKY